MVRPHNEYANSVWTPFGNSLVQVRHLRSDAYSAEQVLLNKRQI